MEPDPLYPCLRAVASRVGGQSVVKLFLLIPGSKDAISGPRSEENLALIQTIVGNNSSAISTLTQLLQTPYNSWLYIPAPITSAFLRLDPFWDPLRGDPAFQKLCEDKQK